MKWILQSIVFRSKNNGQIYKYSVNIPWNWSLKSNKNYRKICSCNSTTAMKTFEISRQDVRMQSWNATWISIFQFNLHESRFVKDHRFIFFLLELYFIRQLYGSIKSYYVNRYYRQWKICYYSKVYRMLIIEIFECNVAIWELFCCWNW